MASKKRTSKKRSHSLNLFSLIQPYLALLRASENHGFQAVAEALSSLAKRGRKYHGIYVVSSLFLIVVGASLLIYPAVKKALVASQPPQSTVALDQSLEKPAKVYIPKLNRTLYVSDGYFRDNRWIVSDTGVSYWPDSALPGTGNTVIYGHNTRDKLGGLWRVGDGDHIYVVLANGNFVKYQVFEKKEIKPTQVEILNQTADKRLTLYTCSGFLDSARFVVTANQVII